ncbi:ABC transporter permease [Kaustia mangrovi]|uniref:ABC transporter permease n=1 Tax=Kaustia mangrovi TaxID=2593653 RepID=A0A7S8HDL3_9HYPH|nr:ABC transporter permease [Kaustia mangrovi]QPC44594.1 ABC transporter permease [Kaustia mangrovi]
MPSLANIARLGVKEFRSLKADPVLSVLILYVFTLAIYSVATGVQFEVRNAAVAVADEDRSHLSRRIAGAIQPPYFSPADEIAPAEITPAMDAGRYVFVIEIPPDFEKDVLRGHRPSVLIDIDATAMAQAGNGASYLQKIVAQEVAGYLSQGADAGQAVRVVTRARFNPNLQSMWFTAVMQVINNITILSVILTGAALIREREHGTLEHLLVMPVSPAEVMLAKIWANGLVIATAALLSLLLVVEGLLGVPVHGSLALFIAGAVLYQFSVTALGILLATFTRSMAQFGLLIIPVIVIMNLLSGSTTPLESMPVWLQNVTQLMPSTHFVAFAQAVLYRGAGLSIVWPELVWIAGIDVAVFAIALSRFRTTMLSAR